MRAHGGRAVMIALCAVAALGCPREASASGWAVGAGTGAAGAAGLARSQPVVAPAGVTAACAAPSTAKTVTVTWAAIPNATYTVSQSSTSATTGYTVVATGVTSTSWTSGALKQNNTYWFVVSATLGGTWTSVDSAPTAGNAIRAKAPFCG